MDLLHAGHVIADSSQALFESKAVIQATSMAGVTAVRVYGPTPALMGGGRSCRD